MIPVDFEELEKPRFLPPFGWYVSGVRPADPTNPGGNSWYLHDDLVVRDYCNDDDFPQTSGWFKTEDDAYHYSIGYYLKHNENYPYITEALVALAETLDDGSSQVMEF